MDFNLSEEQLRRFWSKVNKNTANGCWEWTAGLTMVVEGMNGQRGGYGRFRLGATTFMAHRVSFSLNGGTLVDGMVIDHLCRNPRCVNPAHLEQVTYSENMLRGVRPKLLMSHCKSGHLLDEKNTGFKTNTNGRKNRYCKKCKQAQDARHRGVPLELIGKRRLGRPPKKV